MDLKAKNKINNKSGTFKILIKSKDIDKDIKNIENSVEELNKQETTNNLNDNTSNVNKETREDNLEKDNLESEIEKKTSVPKCTKTIPVNKTLDFVPEEDTDSDEIEEDETKNDKKPDDPQTSYDPANVHYEGDIAIYTDKKSGYQYSWNKESNEWKPKENVQYGFEDDTHTYTDAEGIKYFWDKDKNAWFPKIDDDFMAKYQMSYGFVDNTTKTEDVKKEDVKKEDVKKDVNKDIKEDVKVDKSLKRKIPSDPTWFDVKDEENKNVYVSNLPTDITEEEFVDLMQKCGLVMRDVATGKMKVKLYVVPGTDILKGDALCTYIKIESVDLALNVLDDYLYRGKRITVERAKFEMKGNYNASLKPKKKKKKEKDKLKKMQEKLFDWRPDKLRGERSKHERVVIVKNVFDPDIFDKDVGLILEYQQDLREECSKCGDVRKVTIYDRHPEGVAQVNMKEAEQADEVVNLLHGRWFGQRKISAEIWDGKTKFKIAETEAQISKRINEWDKFLEMKDETGGKKSSETAETTNEEKKNELTPEEKLGNNEKVDEEIKSDNINEEKKNELAPEEKLEKNEKVDEEIKSDNIVKEN